MAKVSAINKNNRRKKMIEQAAPKRAKLKAIAEDQSLPTEVRLAAMISLSEMPRNSSRVRYRNRCAITGRPRAYYGQFGMSRLALRDLGLWGEIPGLTKSSW